MMTCPGCGVAHVELHADMPLVQLHNLGAVSTGWLEQAGIHTVAELAALGAVVAYLRVEAMGVKPSLNLLYALEGAIHGEHWLQAKRHRKTELLAALHGAREQAAL